MNKQWLVWLQVTIEEDTYKSKNTLTFNMFKLMLNMTFFKHSPSTFSVLDLLFCEWLIPKCTQEEVLCFQAPLTSDTCWFFLLLLLPLIWASVNVTTFMLYVLPLFHHKIPHLFFLKKTYVKEKNKALTVSAFTRLFTVHQQSRCPTEIVMADWSLLFTGLNLSQMESPLGFTPTKFLRIWLKRKLPGSVRKLHD